MIALSLEVVAEIVGGRVEGDGDGVVVTGPVVIDGREAGPGSLFVAFVGEHVDGHDHAPQAADQRRRRGPRHPGDRAADRAWSRTRRPRSSGSRRTSSRRCARDDLTVLALTGSQGKTSTKDLLAAVLAEAGPTVATYGSFNNELGMPLTALRVEPDTRYLVLEMGARGRGHLTELTDLVAPGRVGRAQRRHGPPRRVRLPRRDRARPRASWSPGCGPTASPCSTPTTSGSPRWRRWRRGGC